MISGGVILKNLLIDGLLQAPFAETFIWICQKVFHVRYHQGLSMYDQLFRSNKTWWLASGLFVLLLLVFYITLSRMTRYFDQISVGIDKLVEESDDKISLPPELDFMEHKLNKIKGAVEKRTREAQDAEQRKNDLVVYLAHDIKTPLTSVIGYLNLVHEVDDMPVEQRRKYIGITLEKAYRLDQLINEFFEITRFSLQSIVLNKSKINLGFMLRQMVDEFYPMLAPQGKQAVVNASDDLILWGDGDKLARVFNNILKNAISYSDEHSTIDILAVPQAENIVITFTNYGKLIPPQKLETIFEKFYRLDEARSSHTGGAGLGLAIVKEIVTAHGGTITAASSEEKTVFTVTLPIQGNELRKS